MATPELKDRLTSLGGSKFENFLYIVGVDKFIELIFPKMGPKTQKKVSNFPDDESQFEMKSIDDETRNGFIEAYHSSSSLGGGKTESGENSLESFGEFGERESESII